MSEQLKNYDAATWSHRYDELPAEAFATFLGRRMKHSCGLFRGPDDSLDAAQEHMLQLTANMLGIAPGMRVLDVGCGWGSLAFFLAERYGCEVVGITPSRSQSDHIRGRAQAMGLSDRISILNGAFPDATPGGLFDAVALDGVIEHIPRHEVPLRRLRSLTRRNGRLHLSASCYRNRAMQMEYQRQPASIRAANMFGFTALPTLSQLLGALESAGWSISHQSDLTAHYLRTILEWRGRVSIARDRMEQLASGFAEEIDAHFDAANGSLGQGVMHYAIGAIRSRDGLRVEPIWLRPELDTADRA